MHSAASPLTHDLLALRGESRRGALTFAILRPARSSRGGLVVRERRMHAAHGFVGACMHCRSAPDLLAAHCPPMTLTEARAR